MKKITEKKIGKTIMVIVVDDDFVASIVCKKGQGKKADHSHELNDCYEMLPSVAMEAFSRESVTDPMSPMLKSAITDIWEIAAEADPWYQAIFEQEFA